MNKYTQTLIEREAREYSLDTDVKHIGELSIDYHSRKAKTEKDYRVGASFAFSLFKWRKVSEEPIPIEQIIVLRLGDNYTVMIISDEEIAKYAQDKFKDYEWMPIPNND